MCCLLVDNFWLVPMWATTAAMSPHLLLSPLFCRTFLPAQVLSAQHV